LGSSLNLNIIDPSNKGNTVTSNALYYYEFSTSKISKIFEVADAIINIFKVN
jgi:predicted transcriptional regulator